MHFLSSVLAAFISILCLRPTAGQLESCDQVNCPLVGAAWHCPVGNVTNVGLGIAGFENLISLGKKLTWTVGLSNPDVSNSTETLWERQFYLGTPPTLDLKATETFGGCAFFFEDTMRKLHFAANLDNDTSDGTCADVMGSACVDDLVQQATEHIVNIASEGLNQTTTCELLQKFIADNPPDSCAQIAPDTWGRIVVKELTGKTSSLEPLSQSHCTITTGGPDYHVALANVESLIAEPYGPLVTPFVYALTPVLTIFYPRLQSSPLQAPAANLVCLKPLDIDTSSSPRYPNMAAGRLLGSAPWQFGVISLSLLCIFAWL